MIDGQQLDKKITNWYNMELRLNCGDEKIIMPVDIVLQMVNEFYFRLDKGHVVEAIAKGEMFDGRIR